MSRDDRILKLALFGIAAADIADILQVSLVGDVQRVVGNIAGITLEQRIVDLLATGHGVNAIVDLIGPQVSAHLIRTVIQQSQLSGSRYP